MSEGESGPVRVISLIGGECSGKSTLAQELSRLLDGVLVIEQLRLFVDEHGRAPVREEQAAVMASQVMAESTAIRLASVTGRDWVLSDPAALMTAIYSVAYFNDESLLPAAIEHQGAYVLTIWCDVDLPWEADGAQRDGPQERQRVHDVIANVVEQHSIDVLKVSGSVEERVARVSATLRSQALIS